MTAASLVDADPGATSELYFDAGLPGFPDVHRFRLVSWGERPNPFSLLQCVDRGDLAFVVVPPEVFFPDYAPAITGDAAARLGLRDAADAIVLVIVTLGTSPAEATANLLGPVVVNRTNGRSAQLVLDSSSYGVQTPLRAA